MVGGHSFQCSDGFEVLKPFLCLSQHRFSMRHAGFDQGHGFRHFRSDPSDAAIDLLRKESIVQRTCIIRSGNRDEQQTKGLRRLVGTGVHG